VLIKQEIRSQQRTPVPDPAERRPLAAGNQAVARYVTALQRAPRPLPASTPGTLPGSGVLQRPERTPAALAQQLGEDFDARDAAQMEPQAPSAEAAVLALARLDGMPADDVIATLQILRLNGSPAAPGSRAPFAWIVQSSASGSPRTRAAIAALATPANVTGAALAGLPGEDRAQVEAFLNVGSWDDPLVGLPRKHPKREPVLSADQRRQLEFIRRRREMVADRGPALARTGNGRLAYNGTPSEDPRPTNAAAGSLNAAIWQELNGEGSASSVNTYDSEKFTWGKGWSGKALLKNVMTAFFALDPAARQELMEAGFTYSQGKWLFVDVDRGHVLEGLDALEAFRSDRRFVSLVIHLVEDAEHQQHFVDAQWQVLSSGHGAGNVPQAVRDAWPSRWTTESVRFAAHCVHWGYSWSELAAAGPDIKALVRWIAGRKSTQEKSGARLVDTMPARTIMHFSGGAATRFLGAAGPMPGAPDPKVFYFRVGAESYRGLAP
jgi:hypothetical protein